MSVKTRQEIKDDLIDMADGKIKSGSTKGRHTTGVFEIPLLAAYITQEVEKAEKDAVYKWWKARIIPYAHDGTVDLSHFQVELAALKNGGHHAEGE